MWHIDKTYRHILAFMLSAVLLLTLTAASLFIVMHADHDCSGENCPVCEDIRHTQSVFRMFADGSGTVTAVALLFALFVTGVCVMVLQPVFVFTLVRLKVQLND